MKRGLFVGRFQPFHKGHNSVIDLMAAAKDLEEIIIGVGSAQVKETLYNPFSLEERKEIIVNSLKDLNKPFHIVGIEDINNYDLWVGHVEKLCPDFDVVYSGNTIVRRLFEEKGYEVRRIDEEKSISGIEIRNLMIKGEGWEQFMPEDSLKVIQELGGANRLREISTKYFKPSVCTDIVVNYKNQGIVLIQRGNEPFKDKWAFPGGHFDLKDYNLRECAARELFEETGIKVKSEDLRLIKEYSDFGRDPRGPTLTVAYYIDVLEGELKAGDDAKNVKVFREIPLDLAFDHNKMWNDCKEKHGLKEGEE